MLFWDRKGFKCPISSPSNGPIGSEWIIEFLATILWYIVPDFYIHNFLPNTLSQLEEEKRKKLIKGGRTLGLKELKDLTSANEEVSSVSPLFRNFCIMCTEKILSVTGDLWIIDFHTLNCIIDWSRKMILHYFYFYNFR